LVHLSSCELSGSRKERGMSEGFNATQREIEILEARKEVERLRKVLREIDFYSTDPWARNKIRIALSSGNHKADQALTDVSNTSGDRK
jgi:hypothetical protein